MAPDVDNVLSKKRKSEHQTAGSNGMTVHLLSRKIEKGNAEQSCKPRIDQGSSNSSYCKIVCDQYVRLPHDPYNSRNDLVDWLKKQANDNEI